MFIALQAFAMDTENKPDFTLAVFATKRTRIELLEKANQMNIRAYNVNYKSEVDLENNCVKNVWMRKNGEWQQIKQAPLPDVVYDFGVYKGAPYGKEVANRLKDQLRLRKIPFINPEESMGVINDKVLFSTIMQKNNISHPETYNFTKTKLKMMLKKYDLLFLKPTLGSKGHGIMIVSKITGSKPSRYSLSFKVKQDGKWKTVGSDSLLKKQVYNAIALARKKLNKEKNPYLIQQGIKSFTCNDNQTDFRINVQRGNNGELSSTGMMMRVGGNLAQGGRPTDYAIVFRKNNLPVLKIEQELKDIAVNTHKALEEHTQTKIGDLGMDAVIDSDGKAYIIEANHKNGYPHMYIEKNPHIEKLFGLPPALDFCKKMDMAHEDHLLEYARYLVQQAQIK